jgi:formylglycine-generating enzyme required for sulfatase activity
MTGFANAEFSMGGKMLEVLKEIAPKVDHAAVVMIRELLPMLGLWRAIETVAPALGVRARVASVHSEVDIEGEVKATAQDPNAGLIVLANPVTNVHRNLIVTLAAQHRLPVYAYRYCVVGGGLILYGIDPTDQYRRAASYVALGSTADITQLRAYVDEFPKGSNAAQAQMRIAALQKEAAEQRAAEQRRAQETAEWGAVAASTDRAMIEAFLKQWPKGQHADAARARLRELRSGSGGMRRGLMLGAGATGAVAALIFSGWVWYQQNRLLPIFWNVSTSVLTTQAEQALKPGSTFKECADCPEMVVLQAGTFMMGRKDGFDYERPQHQVAIRQAFAVAKFDVTFDEWDACVAHGGCSHEPNDQGWGRGRRPVIYVSWNDAKQYETWISQLTGKAYRLLTEAEWEYAGRAGTTTWCFWGDEIGKGNANCDGCGSQWDNRQTAPVGSFMANALGFTTCKATRTSGLRIATTIIIMGHQTKGRRGHPEVVITASCAAVLGTPLQGSPA